MAALPPGVTIPARTYGFPPEAFDWTRLPDVDTDFLPPEHLEAFVQALTAPEPVHSPGESLHQSPKSLSSLDNNRLSNSHDTPQAAAAAAAAIASAEVPAAPPRSPSSPNSGGSMFITSRSPWATVRERVIGGGSSSRRGGKRRTSYRTGGASNSRKKRKKKLVGGRSKDETREGYLYSLLKLPLLLLSCTVILGESIAYLVTRFYVYLYEQQVAWRGRREGLRRAMRATGNYKEWVVEAKKMDEFFGNGKWKEEDEFAYYDSKTVRRVWEQIRECRERAEAAQRQLQDGAQTDEKEKHAEELRTHVEGLRELVEACVRNNWAGIENPRLYSQTYYGPKNLVQNYVDEVEKSLEFLIETQQLSREEKQQMFERICENYGRTALCLSGGATFAYYHFGVVKALLEEDLLPKIITGTSGGALVAALVATRTNEELKELLVPSLAKHITACRESVAVCARRWWRTGAVFDSLDWAKQCAWWCRGSMTFREAYERTGRILNVSCVPSDAHSPTILCNYRTSPDCVIWSAVIASAAVPSVLNPVVLMKKTRAGQLVPYSFGHKWKDGSLRTDIPTKALNHQFKVNFTIVSQVNPHINLFFFSSRGSVGQPVTHRKGRGWRGGFLGSAMEQFIKLDLIKWLHFVQRLELLPRPLGQDWSGLWLQQFGGNVTIWPNTIASDFYHILSDPTPARLARMIHEGQQSAFPKVKFVSNRLKIERLAERGRREARLPTDTDSGERRGSIDSIPSEHDLRALLRTSRPGGDPAGGSTTGTEDETTDIDGDGEGDNAILIDGIDEGIGGVLDRSRYQGDALSRKLVGGGTESEGSEGGL